jgi:hypothetical protein
MTVFMDARLWWRARAPLVVAAARLRAHPGRAALVASGVAVSAAMLVAALGGSAVTRDRALQHELAELPAGQRAFRVDAFGLPPGATYAGADGEIRGALALLSPRPPLRGTFLHQLRIDGELTQLAAVDAVGAIAGLRSGRLPRTCVPARCEVLQLGDGGRARLDEADLHLVRVGIAAVPRDAPFGESLVARAAGGERAFVLVAAGALAFDRLPAYEPFFRTYSWVAPLRTSDAHFWNVSSLLTRESRVQARLVAHSNFYALSGPDTALLDGKSRGSVSAGRMMLVGGEVSVLMLGFALLAAIGLRRGLGNESRRLLHQGATRPQLWLFQVAEIAAMTAAGALAGLGAGVAAVAAVASAAGLPAGLLLRHSLASWVGAAVVAGAWVAATLVVLIGTRTREDELARRRLGALDFAALGAAAAAGVGLARGGLSSDTLASGGDRTLLLLLPALVCFVVAVVAARLLRPLMRLAERASRRAPSAVRLALLALARAPARTAATAAFLVVSLGLALFAVTYRSTLEQGARDQAAFSVPLDFTVGESDRLVLPLEAAPLARYESLAPGSQGYPVLRRNAEVPGAGASVQSPAVLGVPGAALARLRWRPDFSSAPLSKLVSRIEVDQPARLRGVPLPRDAVTLSLRVRRRGVPLRYGLAIDRGERGVVVVPLGEKPAGLLSAHLAAATAPRELVGLQFTISESQALVVAHHEAESGVVTVPTGSLTLSPLVANGHVVTRWQGFVPIGGAQLERAAAPRLTYSFGESQTMLLRLPQATDDRPLRVVVSPDVARSAGPGGSLVLDFQDVQVPAQVVGVAKRFPDAEQYGEGFVIADESRLATALDAGAPGTGTPGELWLAVPRGSVDRVDAALREPPFDAVSVASRETLEHALATDPLARGIELTLAAAALVALVLGAVGLWLALVSELRDERGELFDLEAQGVAPATLRRQFRLRAAILLAAGALGGAGLGLLLSRIVVSLVRVSASTQQPEPPLLLSPAWGLGALGFAALAAAAAVLLEATTRAAMRGETPARASWSLE